MFAHSYIMSSIPIKYKQFSNRSIDGNLTSTDSPDQRESGSNGNERLILHFPELYNSTLTTFSVILWTTLFVGTGLIPL